ncbi:T9SS type A sorting domain-containing protein [Xanthocytophaga flava]|uniref:T9SS type A sorting domain-containing protein n=1 Tax=Xanthocytophaga flava TaxID=3048013 RepID=UPI0028D03B58|nr:T9SS type A sorting domain-containing protein [Xanthocytophaga flavus]MDJ1470422.1 T9SS type A sorting domain-containing protein [Xanthocytophaga flavus]
MNKLYIVWSWALLTCWNVTAQNTAGVFLHNFKNKTATAPAYEVINFPQGTPASVFTIDFADTVAKVSDYIYGTNANQYSGTYNQEAKLVDYIQKLNPQIIRYPGGLHSDEYFWNVEWDWNLQQPNGASGGWFKNLPTDLPAQMIKSGATISTAVSGYWTPGKGYWTFGLDDYYDFLAKTSTEGLITVNYGYARYGTGLTPVQTAAHLAADWVRYDKGRTKFWEIGNENLYTWSGSYKIITSQNKDGQPEILTPELYGKHCQVFIDSMQKAASEIGAVIYIGVQNDEGVLAGVGNKADWYVDHTYFTNFQENSTVSTILNSVENEVQKYANRTVSESQKWGVPVKASTLTEWNIFAEGSKQAASYVNGMHAVLVLGEMIKHKYGMANRWNIANAWGNGDDMGMFGRGDDTDGSNALWNPRAPFYYMYYFQKFFGDHMVKTTRTSGDGNVVVYASTFSSGEAGIVIVNKGQTDQLIKLTPQNFITPDRYYLYGLTGGTGNGNFSLQVLVNGAGPTQTSIGGPIDKLEAIKAKLVPLSDQIQVSVPKLSVQYILLEKGDDPILGTQLYEDPSLIVYPNPAQKSIQIQWEQNTYHKVEVLNMLGQVVYQQAVPAGFRQIHITSELPSGVYSIRLTGAKGVVLRKLVSQQ